MNLQDLKKKVASPSAVEIIHEKQAISQNQGIQELDEAAQAALRQAEIVLLTRALSISEERFNLLQSQIQQSLSGFNDRIKRIEDNSTMTANAIRIEVAKTQASANEAIAGLQQSALTELRNGGRSLLKEMSEIVQGFRGHYNSRQWFEVFILATAIVNVILLSMIFIKVR